jgi:hypothetical protein
VRTSTQPLNNVRRSWKKTLTHHASPHLLAGGPSQSLRALSVRKLHFSNAANELPQDQSCRGFQQAVSDWVF